jgi:exodeoxyribonuclease VII large subunit
MAENALASATEAAGARPAGVPGYPGPYAVGQYAAGLRQRLRDFTRVCVVGEISNSRVGKGPNVYFELRDADGALPCAMWRNDFERTGLSEEDLRDGAQVVAAGGCDYYVGSASASPRFTFRVQELRPAGEGDLLARLERLRRQLASEGLFELQKRHAIPRLPRRIGVVTAEGSAARRDFLAALERRSWRGTIVWGYAPVQDRRAATAIAAQIRELAAVGDVDAIVVTRGGGSIADLWAFCDEALCRTVALLPVPVISAVGHDVDRTLIDDVSAVCCSTPTHAAEAAVAIDCAVARSQLEAGTRRIHQLGRAAVDRRAPLLTSARRIDVAGRSAVLRRARELAGLSRAPRQHLDQHRVQLHQKVREIRAASMRGLRDRTEFQRRIAAAVLDRKLAAARRDAEREQAALPKLAAELDRAAARLAERRAQALRASRAALNAHDPQRTLERGYALVTAHDGEPLASADALRAAGAFEVRMADGAVAATVDESAAAHADDRMADAGNAATRNEPDPERRPDGRD